jgi:hypothetical protein
VVGEAESVFIQVTHSRDHNRIRIRTVAPDGFGSDKDAAFLAGELRK